MPPVIAAEVEPAERRWVELCLSLGLLGYSRAVDPLSGALALTGLAGPIWPAYGVAVAAISGRRSNGRNADANGADAV